MKELIQAILTMLTAVLIILIVMFGVIFLLNGVKIEGSEKNVSGIVYNTRNNQFISGNTAFSIRAGENTPVTPENQSKFCLPPNSEYIELVNKAAADKNIKVNVTTKKIFTIAAPWYCPSNVIVLEVK